MKLPYQTRAWESLAPLVARLLLAVQFAVAAYFKFAFFNGEVAQTSAVGVPLPAVAVALAFILEVIAVVSFVSGWGVRFISAVLAFYVLLLAILFYHNWTDQMTFGLFVSHLGLTAALLYVSAYGAQSFSIGTRD